MSKHKAELVSLCLKELQRYEVDIVFYNDACAFFNNPEAERFTFSNMTPVQLKEIDIQIDALKIEEPCLLEHSNDDQDDDLLKSNASIVYWATLAVINY